MGEHPVRIQPKMIMAPPPGRGHRIGPVHHERIKTSPSDRPGRRQTSRASAHDHNTLLHDASVDPLPLTVNTRGSPPAGPPPGFPQNPQSGKGGGIDLVTRVGLESRRWLASGAGTAC
jgi:hypothetical protein